MDGYNQPNPTRQLNPSLMIRCGWVKDASLAHARQFALHYFQFAFRKPVLTDPKVPRLTMSNEVFDIAVNISCTQCVDVFQSAGPTGDVAKSNFPGLISRATQTTGSEVGLGQGQWEEDL